LQSNLVSDKRAEVMSYRLKVFLYIGSLSLAAVVIGWRWAWLKDANFFTVIGLSIFMALAIIRIGRRIFGRKGVLAAGAER
jgi:hypothetical protein